MVTKKIQYFIGETQVLRVCRNLANELGVSGSVLRTWTVSNADFPAPVHEELEGGRAVKYYPYEPAMQIIKSKLETYEVNRKRGVGRPTRGNLTKN